MVLIFQLHLKVSDQTLLLNMFLIQCYNHHCHPYCHHIITNIIIIIIIVIIIIGGEGSVEMAEPGASY